MNLDQGQVWAIIIGAGGTISALATTIFKLLTNLISEKDKRILTLETAAAEFVKAKDLEIAEWKRRALGSESREEARH